jgi:hypothetical protein
MKCNFLYQYYGNKNNVHGQLNFKWPEMWGIWKLPSFRCIETTMLLLVTVRGVGVHWNRSLTICGKRILCEVRTVWYMLVSCSWPLKGSGSLVLVTMSEFKQWTNIKFLCRLGKSAAESLVSLSVLYGGHVLTNLLCKTCTVDKNGQESLEDKK